MSKKILISTILLVLILGFVITGPVEAKGFGWGGLGRIGLNLDNWVKRIETMFENWAKILGMSVEKVKNYWAEGKTPKEMMEAENISQEDVQKRMEEMRLEELKNQLQKLVEKGIITQEQANQRLEWMKKQSENRSKKEFFKRGWKRFGRGGFGF
jgi:hypothetical protein